MIKQFLGICVAALTLSSCAALYTPQAEPTLFLREQDGLAVNGNLGTNGSSMFANGNVTKAISDVVSVNANASIGIMGHDVLKGNPFLGEKKQKNVGLNLGLNTTRITKYPMQVWIGLQAGTSSDAYGLSPIIPINTIDTATITYEGINTRYEKMSGNYQALRFGVSHVIVSNYDNNIKKRDVKKMRFDFTGLAYLNFINYNYNNALNFKKQANQLLGYNISMNLGKKKWLLSAKVDFMQPLVQLTNEWRNIQTSVWHPGFSEIPVFVPSISYTRFFKKRYQ